MTMISDDRDFIKHYNGCVRICFTFFWGKTRFSLLMRTHPMMMMKIFRQQNKNKNKEDYDDNNEGIL